MNRFRYSQETAIEKPFNWKQLVRLLQYLKPYSKNLLPKSIIVVLINTAIRLAIPSDYWILDFRKSYLL